MKPLARKFKWWLFFAAGLFLLAGCSTYTYETQSWRIAEANEDSADVIVRYFGIGSTSKDVNKRAEKAKEIIQTWFHTDFAGGRHQNRINKIIKYERRK